MPTLISLITSYLFWLGVFAGGALALAVTYAALAALDACENAHEVEENVGDHQQ